MSSAPHTHSQPPAAPAPDLGPDGAWRASAFERAATWLSALCAVHCLLVPVASAALPLVGASTGAVLGGTVDHLLNIMVVAGGALSALVGYRRHHDLRLSLTMVACIAVYLLGHALEAAWYGVALTVVAGLGLAISSFVSARLGHVHQHGECAH